MAEGKKLSRKRSLIRRSSIDAHHGGNVQHEVHRGHGGDSGTFSELRIRKNESGRTSRPGTGKKLR